MLNGMIVLLASFVTIISGFAAVQSVAGGCGMFRGQQSLQQCMCNQDNFDSFAWAMLADAGLLKAWTGETACEIPMDWFHGSGDAHFLEFVSWLYLYGDHTHDTELTEGARWMALDPSLDGASLWSQGNGGIEGKGFDSRALYDVILPMAAGLDSWLYWNNSCSFNEIVARAMSKATLNKIYDVVTFAQANGANWTVPSRENFTFCLHSWQTDGLSNWMANFVVPVSATDGFNNFARHVRFNPNARADVALSLYNNVVSCSQTVWSAWWKSLTSSSEADRPTDRIKLAQTYALKVLDQLMKAGSCGAPPYTK